MVRTFIFRKCEDGNWIQREEIRLQVLKLEEGAMGQEMQATLEAGKGKETVSSEPPDDM